MFSDQVKAVLQELAELLNNRVNAKDGGPGSGNWGHKGRPGQVGGSGKGGGNQYRGGKGGILYTSSKNDWLNGLSGEKQHKASKFMQSMEALKSPGQNTEAFIMENGTTGNGASAVKEYLDLKGEARGWDKYAGRLIEENLDDDDKKVVEAIGQKYGIAFKGKSVLPDDGDTSAWDADDLRTWNDLKSKAMGGPTSGKEASDELLIAAGLKEAPKTVKIPATKIENDHWADGLAGDDKKQLSILLKNIDSVSASMFDEGNINTAENVAANHVIFYSYARDFNDYLNIKADELGANYYDALKNGESMGNLESDKINTLAEVLQTSIDAENPETELLRKFNPMEKVSYLKLKAYALGMKPLGPQDVELAAAYMQGYLRNNKRAAQREKEREEREKHEKQLEEESLRKAEELKRRFKAGTHEERIKAIDNAKTVEDVANVLRDTALMPSDAQIDLTGVDLKLAKEAAKSYNMVAEQFPFIVGTCAAFSVAKSLDKDYARASLWGALSSIEVNSNWYGSYDKLAESYEHDTQRRWHPAGTDARAIITHEIAHTLDSYLSTRGTNGSTMHRSVTAMFSGKLRRSVYKALGLRIKNVYGKNGTVENLSEYAATNCLEWFAECFAEAMHSPNPRPMATEMMKQLKQILKEEGLIDV